jgi:hypothetical protein
MLWLELGGAHLDLDLVVDVFVGHFGWWSVVILRFEDGTLVEKGFKRSEASRCVKKCSGSQLVARCVKIWGLIQTIGSDD